MIGTTITVTALVFFTFFFCESPKFLYTKGRFQEAREALMLVANFNRVGRKEMDFIFDTEVVNVDPLSVQRHSPSNEQNSSMSFEIENEHDALMKHEEITAPVTLSASMTSDAENITDKTTEYYNNLFKMTIMWSASSFSNYLLNFLNKYLEGSIFMNNYFEGIAGISAVLFGAQIYSKLGKK